MHLKRGKYVEKITTQGNDYLTRVHLTPAPIKTVKPQSFSIIAHLQALWPFQTRLYLHIFSRPDEDRVFHDHPWKFTTIVLWGGYDEESHILANRYSRGTNGVMQEEPSGQIKPDRLGFLSMRSRRATHCHRITRLHRKRVVTLIFRGDRQRDWGFWCPPNSPQYAGFTRSTVNNDTPRWLWVYWREYLGQNDTAVGEQY